MILSDISATLKEAAVSKEKYDTDTLSHRLRLCMRLIKMNQSELARLIGVKPQIIQYLYTKNIKSSRFTFELAEVLGVDYTWLATGVGTMYQPVGVQNEEIKIPFVVWSDLDKIMHPIDIAAHQAFIFSSTPASGRLIASQTDDMAMEPRFEKGITIVFDLDEAAAIGDFVLVKLKNTNSWIFREYIESEQQIIVSPINKRLYKDIILTPEDQIVGVLTQTICNFKRPRI